jgi:DNA (cytosine-5)-methyltransferase 1
MQQSIFDIMFPKFKITKPIRLIELFAGYGSQALALKYLGVKFEHWKICEWAIKSIQAYKDAHYTNIDIEFNKDRTKEEIVEELFKLGVSSDYNNSLTKEQLSRYKYDDLVTILKNIAITKNLVNICNVKGKDLEIVDTDKYEYIMTYSFPCQDLSLAGLGKGMARDGGTRSGMLWQVERILDECENLPQILLMENVPEVKGTKNVKYFNEWQHKLESLGYKSYHQNLIATDYGIPQTRNRTFMISILGEYNYTFPQPIPLKLKLKDMLEDNVSEKYYLSDKMINFFKNNEIKQQEKGNGFKWNVSDGDTIGKTITTRAGARMDDNFIAIPEAAKKGYAEATDGDGVYINRPHQKRGCVQKNKIQTLKASPDTGVVVNSNIKNINDEKGTFSTLGTNCGSSTSAGGGVVKQDLRIRKLTPKECGRLMNVKNEDINKISVNQSDSSMYHIFGDSICTNILMAIFGELLEIDWKEKLEEMLYGNI